MDIKSNSSRKLSWADLIVLRGAIDRGPYLIWGLLLFFLKFNLNKYLSLGLKLPQLRPAALPATGTLFRDYWFFPEGLKFKTALLLVLISLPFIWSGIALTLRRLRSIGAPLWLVLFFFVPLINYLLFIILSLIPEGSGDISNALSNKGDRGPGGISAANYSEGGLGSCFACDCYYGALGMKFSVTATPPPMEEWSPFRHIHPPHLDNFFVSNGGQFRLIRLENGRTKVEGTTWYRHQISPAWYWKWFSDEIIHRIHMRVLVHVKRLSEGAEA